MRSMGRGPWAEAGAIVRDADGRMVCRVSRIEDRRLIAALPYLLELARLVVSETNEDENGDMPNHPRGALLTLRKAAELAISKTVTP